MQVFGTLQKSEFWNFVWRRVENIIGKGFFLYPLPHMPILGCFNSAANENMMSKIWTNGDTII